MKRSKLLMTFVFLAAISSAFAFKAKHEKLFSSNKNVFQQITSPQSCPSIVCSDDETRPQCIADLSKLYQAQNPSNTSLCMTPEVTFLYQRIP